MRSTYYLSLFMLIKYFENENLTIEYNSFIGSKRYRVAFLKLI